jgi:hypothetical protein
VNHITNTITVLCAECSKIGHLKPEQSQVREICVVQAVDGKRGKRKILRCCKHCTSLETFDIENETQEDVSPS